MRCLNFFVILIVILLCFPLVGCASSFKALTKTDFEFLHSLSEIKAIEIVKINEIEQIQNVSATPPVIDNAPSFDVICTVQNIERFMEDFSKIECYLSSPPKSPSAGDIGIKIIYNNENYEIICSRGQAEYRNGFYYSDCGRHSFDETQFDEMLSKYIDNIKKNDR